MTKLWSFYVESAMNLGPCDTAETKDSFPLLCVKDGFEPGAAVANLFCGGLVVRWSAVARRHDHDVPQFEAVVDVDRLGLIANSGFVEGTEEPVTRTVASEHAAGSICAMSSRSKANDEEFGLWVAHRRHRFGPVGFSREPLWRVGG